ncbi:MAG: hypothetical protein RL557_421 [archaeon]
MNLKKKKILAAKTLNVGKNRIVFNSEALNEIKEAITKQDIKGLFEEGAIKIKPIRGRKTIVKRTRRRGAGKIKIKVGHRKRDYMHLTRKLRVYIKYARINNQVSKDIYKDVRKKIKNRYFKSLANLKEYLKSIATQVEVKKSAKKGKGGKSKK